MDRTALALIAPWFLLLIVLGMQYRQHRHVHIGYSAVMFGLALSSLDHYLGSHGMMRSIQKNVIQPMAILSTLTGCWLTLKDVLRAQRNADLETESESVDSVDMRQGSSGLEDNQKPVSHDHTGEEIMTLNRIIK